MAVCPAGEWPWPFACSVNSAEQGRPDTCRPVHDASASGLRQVKSVVGNDRRRTKRAAAQAPAASGPRRRSLPQVEGRKRSGFASPRSGHCFNNGKQSIYNGLSGAAATGSSCTPRDWHSASPSTLDGANFSRRHFGPTARRETPLLLSAATSRAGHEWRWVLRSARPKPRPDNKRPGHRFRLRAQLSRSHFAVYAVCARTARIKCRIKCEGRIRAAGTVANALNLEQIFWEPWTSADNASVCRPYRRGILGRQSGGTTGLTGATAHGD